MEWQDSSCHLHCPSEVDVAQLKEERKAKEEVLKAKAQEAGGEIPIDVRKEQQDEEAARDAQLHPSVGLYKGSSSIPFDGFTAEKGEPLACIQLHLRLLPDSQADDSSVPEDVVALWERHWAKLHAILMPCFGDVVVPENASPLDAPSKLDVVSWFELRASPAVMDRLFYSYACLLRFYGWKLHNEETGEVDRCANWKERYGSLEENFNAVPSGQSYYSHLGRVVRFLLELGFLRMAARLVVFLLEEICVGRLQFLENRVVNVWVPLLREAGGDLDLQLVDKMLKKAAKRHDSDSD